MSFLSKNIRFLRSKYQLHLKEMAEKCKIPLENITQLEDNLDKAGIEHLLRIAKLFNTNIEHLVDSDIEETYNIAKKFKLGLLAMDIDGVLTDGSLYYSESGDELKKFNARDGLTLIRFTAAGNQVAFVSSSLNDNIIKRRAERLGVQHVYFGTWEKLEAIQKCCDELNIGMGNVAYIGDDLNDLAVFDEVGLSFCPADAVEEVKNKATIVLSKKGGDGCIREIIDKYLSL